MHVRQNPPTALAVAETSLVSETRATLPTREAAPQFSRAEQTLRKWASTGTGPCEPLRINGRLAWRVSDIRRLNGLSE